MEREGKIYSAKGLWHHFNPKAIFLLIDLSNFCIFLLFFSFFLMVFRILVYFLEFLLAYFYWYSREEHAHCFYVSFDEINAIKAI